MKRRSFLKASGATISASVFSGVLGANDRVQTAVIGVRGRGSGLTETFAGLDGADVRYICDVDSRILDERAGAAEEISGKRPQVEGDFRRILDDADVDAVVIAAPDHWHATMAVMACQAGKDVYLEKPVSHNISEGSAIMEAVRQYGRVLQVGTQMRSLASAEEGVQYARSGGIGDLLMAKVWNNQLRDDIGHHENSPVPDGVDYDMWLGPAPERPFNQNRFHYNWHWFWDYGTGDIGNDGVHDLDIARAAMGISEHPIRASATGGIRYFKDDRETPDTQVVTYTYPSGVTVLFEMRIWAPYQVHGAENGLMLFGTEGRMIYRRRQGWEVFGEKEEKIRDISAEGDDPSAHFVNFLECIRSRETPHCPIDGGHQSSVLAHLGNLSLRLQRDLQFDPATESLQNDPEANRHLTRDYREPWTQLRKA